MNQLNICYAKDARLGPIEIIREDEKWSEQDCLEPTTNDLVRHWWTIWGKILVVKDWWLSSMQLLLLRLLYHEALQNDRPKVKGCLTSGLYL